MLGSLLYISNKTRPDICYGANMCSRQVQKPLNQDVTAIKRMLTYLKGSLNSGISYNWTDSSKELTGNCDSDYAGDEKLRRSITGYIIYYHGGPIRWCTRKRPVVALSTAEVEYIAAAEWTKCLMCLKIGLKELLSKEVLTLKTIFRQSNFGKKLCFNS